MSVDVRNILGKGPNDPKVQDLYTVDKQLGKGAFGIVRIAIEKSTGARYAVKSISKAKLSCKEDVKDVQNEVAILNHVGGHVNVVSVKSSHEDVENVHIVMEICEGGELFDSIVESGNFTEKKAAMHFRKMVDVVAHCHQLGVMHRDLKPENFLLTAGGDAGELKLTDFGLGVFFKAGERFRDLVGSPYYVAPEVLRKNYGFEADLWSLGVILYILLSGLPPFWGDTEDQIFKMVLAGHVDFDSEPWPSISEAAKDCVRGLLCMDVKKRSTAADVLRHEWLAKEGVAKDVNLDHVVLKRMRAFAQMNKLKRMALMVVGQHLSADEIAGMQALFKSIDTDGSGTITVDELRTAMSQHDAKIGKEEVAALMQLADVDGDGLIDYNEFVAATMHVSKLERDDLLQAAFRSIDTDGSGSISVDELTAALKQFGIYDDASELLRNADSNGDGMIDYVEFTYLMRNQQTGTKQLSRGRHF